MSDMMDDINKFSKIWDDAVQKGIFADAPKPAGKQAETDFFGQYLNDEYDMDKPLNEVDVKYWAKLSKKADPLFEESTTEDSKKNTDALANAHNPVYPNTVGKDQDVNVTPNWGFGGKEIEQLEELKKELHNLEVKLNSVIDEKKSENDTPKGDKIQEKIDSLKKEIDELSDSLSGDRFSHPAR
jgi:hypothetical protein